MRTPEAVSPQCGERQFSIEDSARRAMSTIAELGLTARLASYGGEPTAWRCQLLRRGRAVPWGLGHGKGEGVSARAGALYEALEHHVIGRREITAGTVQLRTCGQVADSMLASEPHAELLAEQPANLIACRIYREIDGPGTLELPLFLSTVAWVHDDAAPLRARLGDTTDYRRLAAYSSNNGSAIGGTVTEALVHAINEAIERDAFSLFLAQTYLTDGSAPPAVYDPATLPADLLDVKQRIEARLGREVWLIDITSDLGVPTTLAYAAGPVGNQLGGFGTSLSRRHSVYRALAELLEVRITEDEAIIARRTADIGRLSPFPLLHACATFDLAGRVEHVRRASYVDTVAPATPDGHLRRLRDALECAGFRPYFDRVHTAANGITTVQVHVPGLENFQIVTEGKAVAPGARCHTYLRETSALCYSS